MNSLVRWLAPVLFAASCLPLDACGGSAFCVTATTASSSSTSSSGDGGAAPTAASTGTGGAAGTGGEVADAGIPLPHSIVVFNQHGLRMIDVPLVVNDASGKVVLSTKTDAWGSANLVIPDGGSVTAFDQEGDTFNVTSFVAPPPGASMAFLIDQSFPVDLQTTPTTYAVNASSLPAGTTSFACSLPCGSGTGFPSNGLCQVTSAGCVASASEDLFVVAYANSMPLGWGSAMWKPTSPGDTLTLSVAVDKPIAALGTAVIGIPVGTLDAYVTVSSGPTSTLGMHDELFQVAPGTSIAGTLNLVGGAESVVTVHEQIDFNASTSGSRSLMRDRTYQGAPASTTFSAASLAAVSLEPLDTTDAAHPSLRFDVGDGPRGDAGSVTIEWHTAMSSVRYTAYFPTDAPTTFRLPDVPPELAPFAPAADRPVDRTTVRYIDIEAVSDYAGFLLTGGSAANVPTPNGLGTVSSTAVAELAP